MSRLRMFFSQLRFFTISGNLIFCFKKSRISLIETDNIITCSSFVYYIPFHKKLHQKKFSLFFYWCLGAFVAKKMHRRDRGNHREKHFILKNLSVLCVLGGE